MIYPVSIDPALYGVYPEIRLGCLRFTAEVREPDERFWSEMEETCLPQVRAAIDGKGWSEIPDATASRPRRSCGASGARIRSIASIPSWT